ncbi:hypothetical protein MIR68_005418 [Amoeboaphelidium protococcarum]|nr:hypothetical protein MIR68_005418 [Amoeboaphelidium protococcarum]
MNVTALDIINLLNRHEDEDFRRACEIIKDVCSMKDYPIAKKLQWISDIISFDFYTPLHEELVQRFDAEDNSAVQLIVDTFTAVIDAYSLECCDQKRMISPLCSKILTQDYSQTISRHLGQINQYTKSVLLLLISITKCSRHLGRLVYQNFDWKSKAVPKLQNCQQHDIRAVYIHFICTLIQSNDSEIIHSLVFLKVGGVTSLFKDLKSDDIHTIRLLLSTCYQSVICNKDLKFGCQLHLLSKMVVGNLFQLLDSADHQELHNDISEFIRNVATQTGVGLCLQDQTLLMDSKNDDDNNINGASHGTKQQSTKSILLFICDKLVQSLDQESYKDLLLEIIQTNTYLMPSIMRTQSRNLAAQKSQVWLDQCSVLISILDLSIIVTDLTRNGAEDDVSQSIEAEHLIDYVVPAMCSKSVLSRCLQNQCGLIKFVSILLLNAIMKRLKRVIGILEDQNLSSVVARLKEIVFRKLPEAQVVIGIIAYIDKAKLSENSDGKPAEDADKDGLLLRDLKDQQNDAGLFDQFNDYESLYIGILNALTHYRALMSSVDGDTQADTFKFDCGKAFKGLDGVLQCILNQKGLTDQQLLLLEAVIDLLKVSLGDVNWLVVESSTNLSRFGTLVVICRYLKQASSQLSADIHNLLLNILVQYSAFKYHRLEAELVIETLVNGSGSAQLCGGLDESLSVVDQVIVAVCKSPQNYVSEYQEICMASMQGDQSTDDDKVSAHLSQLAVPNAILPTIGNSSELSIRKSPFSMFWVVLFKKLKLFYLENADSKDVQRVVFKFISRLLCHFMLLNQVEFQCIYAQLEILVSKLTGQSDITNLIDSFEASSLSGNPVYYLLIPMVVVHRIKCAYKESGDRNTNILDFDSLCLHLIKSKQAIYYSDLLCVYRGLCSQEKYIQAVLFWNNICSLIKDAQQLQSAKEEWFQLILSLPQSDRLAEALLAVILIDRKKQSIMCLSDQQKQIIVEKIRQFSGLQSNAALYSLVQSLALASPSSRCSTQRELSVNCGVVDLNDQGALIPEMNLNEQELVSILNQEIKSGDVVGFIEDIDGKQMVQLALEVDKSEDSLYKVMETLKYSFAYLSLSDTQDLGILFEKNIIALCLCCTSSQRLILRKFAWCIINACYRVFKKSSVIDILEDKFATSTPSTGKDDGVQQRNFQSKRKSKKSFNEYDLRIRNVPTRRQMFLITNLFVESALVNYDVSIQRVHEIVVPNLISVFAAKCMLILQHPYSEMFQIINEYLLSKLILDFQKVPLFRQLIYSTDVFHARMHRLWILDLLVHGIKTQEDARIAIKCHVKNILMPLAEYEADYKTANLMKEVLSQLQHTSLQLKTE